MYIVVFCKTTSPTTRTNTIPLSTRVKFPYPATVSFNVNHLTVRVKYNHAIAVSPVLIHHIHNIVMEDAVYSYNLAEAKLGEYNMQRLTSDKGGSIYQLYNCKSFV